MTGDGVSGAAGEDVLAAGQYEADGTGTAYGRLCERQAELRSAKIVVRARIDIESAALLVA